MSAVGNISTTRAQQPHEQNGHGEEDEYRWWRERSRVVITPTASPSAMGLFAFAAATLMVSGDLAGWYGTSHTFIYFAPFALAFGGIGQFLAGMWSYKARDTIATVVHTMWGSFWIGFGILWLMIGGKALAMPAGAGSTHIVGLGMWFVVLSVLTIICAMAAIGKSIAVFTTLGLLSAGSALLAAGYIGGFHTTIVAGGWVLVASVAAAIYTGAALMFADSYGRTILPLGTFKKDENVPGRVISHPIAYEGGMPGVRVGQ
ncbi:MAG: acetate uptake transporter [Acidimicrobiales bacterium]